MVVVFTFNTYTMNLIHIIEQQIENEIKELPFTMMYNKITSLGIKLTKYFCPRRLQRKLRSVIGRY